MNDLENQRARAEAAERVPRALRSARRAQLWAGLNRYLASEAVHAHKVAEAEREAEHAPERKRSAGPPAQRRPEPSEEEPTG
jgi:hypothetical protein